jgi:Flp pilus assembly protein CpaB
VTAVVAVSAGLGVGSIVSSAEATRAAWGRSVTVAVAHHDLGPGAALRAGDVELVARPAAAVPDGALRSIPDGRLLHHAVFAGEVVLDAHLAPAGRRGLAARLDGHQRAVALPVGPGLLPPLESGQLVDLVGVSPEGEVAVLAEDVEVLHVDDDAVTAAVDERDVQAVVTALATGVVTVTLIGAG